MLREPKLSTFYSPPKHDLRLNWDSAGNHGDEGESIPDWPDTGQLFGEDPDYQKTVKGIQDIIETTLERAEDYSKVCYNMISETRLFIQESL